MKAVDLFSGCGGLTLGLKKSGIDVVAAYENWEPAVKIYERNFSHQVNRFDLNDTEKAIKHISNYKPDIIVGGPPCQDFSSAGKRNEKGSRSDLTLAYAKIISSVSPDWFIMENVARIEKLKIFSEVKKLLTLAGYGLTEVILDASLCGVPQIRKRMFLIGKKGENKNFLNKYLFEQFAQKSMTLRDYFGESLGTTYYYRHARSYSRRAIFSIDEPSPTIRGVNRPVPPDYKFHSGDVSKDLSVIRPLTSLERAEIQTFPKNFDWNNTPKSVLEQIIGNAVPVDLAKFVGNAILNFIADKNHTQQKTKTITKSIYTYNHSIGNQIQLE